MTTPGRQLVLDRRRDQLETDIKSAINFLCGTDLVLSLMRAADSYAGKCAEAAGHDEFVNDILENAPEQWDNDDAAEAIAVSYVRHLESEVRRLGGAFHPVELDDEVTP